MENTDNASEGAITVTTITAHTKLFSWEINLFSIEHYFSIFGTTEFPEIGKITVNFGRQRNPLTDKRIFFTAIWFIIQCPVGPEPHNVCLKLWQNGSMHVTGLRDHTIEMPWLSAWIGSFFDHIQSRPVTCTIQREPKNYNLLVCEHNVIWSSHSKRPIGWIPPCLATKTRYDPPAVLILHGKPVKFESKSSSSFPFVTTKGKKERFAKDGEKIHASYAHLDRVGKDTFQFATTDHVTMDYKDMISKKLQWKIVCLNAKCEINREPSKRQWLSRDHFAEYMREVYKNIMTSFDPNSYKAVQLTFYDEESSFLKRRQYSYNEDLQAENELQEFPRTLLSSSTTLLSDGGKQIGTVSVTSTGLFWLYGFKDLDVAKDVASDVVNLLRLYKRYYSQEDKNLTSVFI